jgi:hypothetical protein
VRKLALAVSLSIIGSAVVSGQRPATVYDPGDRIALPQGIKVVEPTHTPQARAARIQGYVVVEAIILATGMVGDVKVVQSELWPYLGPSAKDQGAPKFLTPAEVAKFGLDKQAINAAKQSTFSPGTKDGQRVAVRILIRMKFELGSSTR